MLIKEMHRVKILRTDGYLALVFTDGPIRRGIVNILKKQFMAKSSWRNYVLFYLPIFDDYSRVYFIRGVEFRIEPDGFTPMEGLALVTRETNEALFKEITGKVMTDLSLTFEESAG